MTTFSSFRIPSFRVWFAGTVAGNIGVWVQTTAQAWTVLTHLTDGDAAAMGIALALQFGPALLLFPLTGWLTDRVDRRRLLLATQSGLALLAVTAGTLLVAGLMTLPGMWACAAILGTINALDLPSRQAFVTDLVPHTSRANAVALNAASLQTARLVGPAIAGVAIVAVGVGWVFVANTLSFLTMAGALLTLRQEGITKRPVSSGDRRLVGGFVYVGSRPSLIVVCTMVLLIGTFAMNFPIFVSTMAIEFGRDADGFGILSSVIAVGSLAGALASARRNSARIPILVFGAGLYAASAALSAVMPTFWSYAGMLVLTGFAITTVLTTANAYIQTTTPEHIRGRVLAFYTAVLLGGTALGGPVIGWVAADFGPRSAILVAAVGSLVSAAVGGAWLIHTRRSST